MCRCLFKLHLALGMTIFLVFPFTRLVHIWSAPIWYLGRRGYQVVRTQRRRARGAGGVTAMSLLGSRANSGGAAGCRQRQWRLDRPRRDRARNAASSGAEKPIAAWQQAARALVIRELLLQEARRAAITPQPMSDANGRRETDEEAMIRGLIEREVTVPEPDDETCRRYYDNNRARFRSPDIYEASHILFAALPADATRVQCARADAAAVLAELREHPERFAELAQRTLALPVGGAGRQPWPDHHRANDARIRAGAHGARARSAVRGAGRDPLRLPCHPSRSQARRPNAAL